MSIKNPFKNSLFVFILCLISFIGAALYGSRIFTESRALSFYLVVEDPGLRESLTEAGDCPVSIIDATAAATLERPDFGPIPVVVGTIRLRQTAGFADTTPVQTASRTWKLNTDWYVPAVPGDADLTAPTASITLTEVPAVPEGWRALPVDDRYVHDENYSLEITTWADCTWLYQGEITATLDQWLSGYFDRYLAENTTAAPEVVFVVNVGDMMVARGVQDILLAEQKENQPSGIEKVFTTTLPLLQNADFTMGNLEGAVTANTKNAIKTYTFKFRKEVLPVLQQAGFDYLMMTNNHCYDYGEEGFMDTLKAFEEYNVASSGIGKNAEEASRFYTTEIKGQKFAIISCGAYPVEQSGFNGEKTATATDKRAGILWQSDKILADVKSWADKGYTVLVNVHGGEEYRFEPNTKQKTFYRSLIDNGAAIVYGSHPHVLQPAEWYNGALIVYSMGNFIFPGMEGMKGGTDSEVVRIGFSDGKILYSEIYPARLEGTGVTLKQPEK